MGCLCTRCTNSIKDFSNVKELLVVFNKTFVKFDGYIILKKDRPNYIDCFNTLKENYEGKTYGVDMDVGKTTLELLPQRIVISLDINKKV